MSGWLGIPILSGIECEFDFGDGWRDTLVQPQAGLCEADAARRPLDEGYLHPVFHASNGLAYRGSGYAQPLGSAAKALRFCDRQENGNKI